MSLRRRWRSMRITYACMGISRQWGVGRWVCLALSLCLSLALASCLPSSTRPVVKIGLIAPFEGLHRRAGYEALGAMRAAIADSEAVIQAAGVDVLPLALDDSNLPVRAYDAANKLLMDPSVGAIIGPLTPSTVQAAADVIAPRNVLWLAPFAVAEHGGFIDLGRASNAKEASTEPFWIAEMVHRMRAEMPGIQRILIAGWSPNGTFLDAEAMARLTPLPVPVIADATTTQMAIQATDAVLWLGDVAAAATFLANLRKQQPNVPLWIGGQGHNPLFYELTTALNEGQGPVYWIAWIDDEYIAWSASHEPATLSAYLVYRATEQAIRMTVKQPWVESTGWQLQVFSE